MFKVTPKLKMKTSFNLCSDPDIFQCSLYRLMQQVHKCHPGGQPPIAMLLPKKNKKNKNVTVIVFLLKKSIDDMLFVSFIHSLFYHIHHDV